MNSKSAGCSSPIIPSTTVTIIVLPPSSEAGGEYLESQKERLEKKGREYFSQL